MKMNPFLIVIFIFCSIVHYAQADLPPSMLPRINQIKMNKQSYDAVHRLHMHWYVNAVKALMGSLGKQLYSKLSQTERNTLVNCLDRVKDKADLIAGAKCLMVAKRRQIKAKPSSRHSTTLTGEESFKIEKDGFTIQLDKKQPNPPSKQLAFFNDRQLPVTTNWRHKKLRFQNFLRKYSHLVRTVNGKNSNGTKSSGTNSNGTTGIHRQLRDFTKFGPRSPTLRHRVRRQAVKLGKLLQDEESTFRRKRTPYRLIANISTRDEEGQKAVNMARLPSLLLQRPPSLIAQLSRFISTMIRGGFITNSTVAPSTWKSSYDRVMKFRKDMDRRRATKGAQAYDLRLLDFVTGNVNQPEKTGNILDSAFDLITSFGANGKSAANLNAKILSPRFIPLMPDRTKHRHFSPSVLAFYKDEASDNIAPLPEVVDSALEIVQQFDAFGIGGELANVTDRLRVAFEKLSGSLLGSQKKKMDRHGFAFLHRDQLEDLYEKQGILNRTDIDLGLDEYAHYTEADRDAALWYSIEHIARNDSEALHPHSRRRRRRRGTTEQFLGLPFSVLNPIALSPYMFSPAIGPVVLGPVILSPNLFSPLLLNPALLSPYVLSPGVGMPFILSPYILSPYVLTPLLWAPFILNPYFLSPNVLNPYLMSPLVLSPYVLCPDVVSPQALGGPILSPYMLSPSVGTESALMATVLSPSFLS